jgi:hypothetical protein
MNTFEADVKAAISSNKQYQAELKKIIKEQFEERKDALVENFTNHPVTKEISAEESPNISNTLGGYGNLFGFLGFDKGSDPIYPVQETLKEKTKLDHISIKTSTDSVLVRYSVPDLDDFNSSAQLEWDATNWVKGIERGISGFQNFMAKAAGKSGQGIQTKGSIKPFTGGANRFRNTKYMSDLINKFKLSINKL